MGIEESKLPLFVKRAYKIYEHMMRVMNKRCHEDVDGKRQAVMPEMNPAEKRAFDAAGFIMRTYYELKVLEQSQTQISFEELIEFTAEEQALVAREPEKMFSIFEQRKRDRLKSLESESPESGHQAPDSRNGQSASGDSLLATRGS